METYGSANESRQFARLSATWNSSILQMLKGDITGSFLTSVQLCHGGCGGAALSLFIFHLVPQAGVQETAKEGRTSEF